MKKLMVFVCVLILLVSLNGCTRVNISDTLDQYLMPDAPMTHTEYLVFPQKADLEQYTVNFYRSVTFSTLLFDDTYIILSCAYTPQQYEQELLRLGRIGATQRDDLFHYPSYVMLFEGRYYEYALIDEGNSTIIYVAAQSSYLAPNCWTEIDDDFPEDYKPIKLPETEICNYVYD